MRSIPAVLLASLLAAACGGSDPGSGTQTLYVEAQAHQQGSTTNTVVNVSIRQSSSSGDVVNEAVVTLRDADGHEYGVPWVGIGKLGLYQVKNIPWSPGWSLQITRGEDGLEASLDAPGATEITNPAEGALFHKNAGDALAVEWKDGDGKSADHVQVKMKKADYDRTLNQDDHRLDVDPGALVIDDKEAVQVVRWNEVNLAGGTAGSYFRATTEDAIDFQVVE